jgi:phosphate transport system permease protein
MMGKWIKSGEPWIWLNAAAVSASLIIVISLLILIAVRGLGHFWPSQVLTFDYLQDDGSSIHVMGEVVQQSEVSLEQLGQQATDIKSENNWITRSLIKTGNRDALGGDFRWVLNPRMQKLDYPTDVIALERREWGNF